LRVPTREPITLLACQHRVEDRQLEPVVRRQADDHHPSAGIQRRMGAAHRSRRRHGDQGDVDATDVRDRGSQVFASVDDVVGPEVLGELQLLVLDVNGDRGATEDLCVLQAVDIQRDLVTYAIRRGDPLTLRHQDIEFTVAPDAPVTFQATTTRTTPPCPRDCLRFDSGGAAAPR
jgi:hypothetical protein